MTPKEKYKLLTNKEFDAVALPAGIQLRLFIMKRKLYFVLFAICMCLSLVSCNDEEESLDYVEQRLVGTYLSGVYDLTTGMVELKSNKTGSSWRELNNGTHVPVSEKNSRARQSRYLKLSMFCRSYRMEALFMPHPLSDR